MKLIFSLLSLFFLVSCSDSPRVLDDEYLPNAYINKYYQYDIEINGMIVSNTSFKANIFPINSGINWIPNDNPASIPSIITKDYNNIRISGVPNIKGEIYIDFLWSTVGTNISVGKYYKKRYILVVSE